MRNHHVPPGRGETRTDYFLYIIHYSCLKLNILPTIYQGILYITYAVSLSGDW